MSAAFLLVKSIQKEFCTTLLDKTLLSKNNLELLPSREVAQLTERHEEIKFAISMFVSLFGAELVAYKGKYDFPKSESLFSVDYQFVLRCNVKNEDALAALSRAFGNVSDKYEATVDGQNFRFFDTRMRFTAERPRK